MSEPGFVSVGMRMGRWVWGAIRRSLRPSGLVLIYDPAYMVRLGAIPMDPLRGEMMLAFLTDEGLVRRRELVRPHAASMKNVRRVHTDRYLESLQRREVVEQVVGAALTDAEAEGLVEAQRLAAGGTVLATAIALRTGLVAVNLGGGFHHAASNRGMGFCALNDIAIAVARLRARGFTEPILVVDLDIHDGNGTRLLFEEDPDGPHLHHPQPGLVAARGSGRHRHRAGDCGGRRDLPQGAAGRAPARWWPRCVPGSCSTWPAPIRPPTTWSATGTSPPRGCSHATGSWSSCCGRPGRRLPSPSCWAAATVATPGATRRDSSDGWRSGKVVEPPSNTDMLLRRAEELHRLLHDGARRLPPTSDWALSPEDLAAFLPGGAAPAAVAGAVHRPGSRAAARATRRAGAGARPRVRPADAGARLPPRRQRHRPPVRRPGEGRAPHGSPLPPRPHRGCPRWKCSTSSGSCCRTRGAPSPPASTPSPARSIRGSACCAT